MNNHKKLSKIPIYKTIKDFILSGINSGQWPVDTKIPAESELVAQFNTSRMTVNRALRELTAEGRLVRKRGNGTFVAPLKPQSGLLEINSIADVIKKSGGIYSCDLYLHCKEKAPPSLASQMQLKPYSDVFHSIIVHKKDNTPIQVADRFVNPMIAPNYLKQDFRQYTPTEYLLKVAPVEKIQHVVEAIIPEAWIRKLLEINNAEPCLALNRTTWSQGIVATRSSFYYPGSRYSLGGTFIPTSTGTIQVA